MKALHHVGITVKDLDASIRFYHDVLGLQFSNEPTPWFEGPELGPAVGVPGAALRQVSLLVAGRRYWTADGPLAATRESQSHLNTLAGSNGAGK